MYAVLRGYTVYAIDMDYQRNRENNALKKWHIANEIKIFCHIHVVNFVPTHSKFEI